MKGLFRIILLLGWFSSLCACSSETVNQERMVNLKKLSGETEIKLTDLNTAINQNRHNAGLYAKRAMLYLESKNTAGAINDINQALTLDSDKGEYYFRKALILRETGKMSAAYDAATSAERLGLKDPEVYILQAELLIRLQRHPESLEKINTALRTSPDNEYALFYRGVSRAATFDTASAVINFRKAIKNAPAFVNPYLQLISIYNAKKDYETAGRYISSASKLDTLNGFLWFEKGLRYLGLRQTDSALFALNTAVKLDPNLYKAHYQLGLFKFKKGNYSAAITHLEKAKAQKNNLPKMTEMLAESYEKTGKYRQAITEYNKILKVMPNDIKSMWGVRRSTWAVRKIERDSLRQQRLQAFYRDTI